ncbi:hypothetical protein [Streptomyces sp. NPDC050848]|uniref:hypothetical protein n=1 Tax=Streptomyces sp. NPDC050848 TaxID=3155791 RepID=UPI0033C390F1
MSQIRTLTALGASLALGGIVAAAVATAGPAPHPARTPASDTVGVAAASSPFAVSETGTLGDHARPGGPVTREQMLRRAQWWVDEKVGYDQRGSRRDEVTGGSWRRDCSGFVSMAWQLPTNRTTLTLPAVGRAIDFKELEPGDILNSREHVVLFAGWIDKGRRTFTYYQESSSRRPTNKSTGDLDAATLSGHPTKGYTAYRYKNVVDSGPTARPKPQAPKAPTPKTPTPKAPVPKAPVAKPKPKPKPAPPAPSTQQNRKVRLSTLVTSQGRLYALAKDGHGVYEWSGDGTAWTKVGGPTKQLYGGAVGLFRTDARTGNIHRYEPSTRRWFLIGGPGRTFAMDGERLYGLSPDGSGIHQWTGKDGQWFKIWDHAGQLYGGGAGLFATNPRNGNLYRYHPTTHSWSLTGGPGRTFAMDGERLYGLSPDGSGVHEWTGRGADWTKVGGPAKHLYGGAGGLFATNPHTGDLYRYDPARRNWSRTGGPGRTFVSGSGGLFGVSPDGSAVFRWTGHGDRWAGVGAPTKRG